MRKKVKKTAPTTVSKGHLPDGKKSPIALKKSEGQYLKTGSTGQSSKDMDSYANKRLSQIARNRKMAAR